MFRGLSDQRSALSAHEMTYINWRRLSDVSPLFARLPEDPCLQTRSATIYEMNDFVGGSFMFVRGNEIVVLI